MGVAFGFDSHGAPPKKDVVVVSSISGEQSIETQIPHFSSFAQLTLFVEQQLSTDPQLALKALNSPSNRSLVEQNSIKVGFLYSQLFFSLQDWPALTAQLKQLSTLSLSNQQQLDFWQLESELAEQQQQYLASVEKRQQIFDALLTSEQYYQAMLQGLNIADFYLSQQNIQGAQYWQGVASNLLDENISLGQKLGFYLTLAKQHRGQSLLEPALEAYESAIKLAHNAKLTSVVNDLQIKAASIYIAMNEPTKAIKLLETAFLTAQRQRDYEQQLLAITQLMHAYLATNQHKEAQKLIKPVNILKRYVKTPTSINGIHYALAKVYSALGNYPKAIEMASALTSDLADSQTTPLDIEVEKLTWLMLSGDSASAAQQLHKLTDNLTAQSLLAPSKHISYLKQLHQQQTAKAQHQQQALNQELTSIRNQKSVMESDYRFWLWILLSALIIIIAVMVFLYKKHRHQQNWQPYIDPVTGALNHSYLVTQLQPLLAQQANFGLIMFDIDNMAAVNAKLSYQGGDELLKKVTALLRQRLGKNKLLVRLAGDRFIVLANGFNAQQSFALAEILRKDLMAMVLNGQNGINLTASFAVIESDSSLSLEQMLKRLRLAINNVKSIAGNGSQFG